MLTISFDKNANNEDVYYLTVKDGSRGVVRLVQADAETLADALSFLRTDRSKAP